MEDQRLDSAESLAHALNVPVAFIRKWTRLGLPHVKLGKTARYDRTEVVAYFKALQEQKGK